MKYLLLLVSVNCFAVTEQQVNDNYSECGYNSPKEFILEKNTTCTDVEAWDECPKTGVLHASGLCEVESREKFLETHEEA